MIYCEANACIQHFQSVTAFNAVLFWQPSNAVFSVSINNSLRKLSYTLYIWLPGVIDLIIFALSLAWRTAYKSLRQNDLTPSESLGLVVHNVHLGPEKSLVYISAFLVVKW